MKNGKYTLIVAPKKYPGKRYRNRYAYEHIVNYWKHSGQIPQKDMEIHHINGNHRDNRIKNLKLLSNKEHRLLHASMMTRTMRNLICTFCKIKFVREARNVDNKIKEGQINFYCGHSCQAKHQHSKGGIK